MLCLLGAWVSTVAFGQWNKVEVDQTQGVSLLYYDGATLWGGTQGTTFRSADKGSTWTKVTAGLNSSLAKSTGFAKVDNAVYATFGGNGNFYAYYTTDGNGWTIDTANWPSMSLPFVGTIHPYSRLTLSHKNEYVLCVLESNYLIYKKQSDAQWTHMSLPSTHRTPDWVYSSGDTLFLYISSSSFTASEVAYTTDLGASWSTRTANACVSRIFPTDVPGKLIGIGVTSLQTINDKLLFMSHDNGISWDSLNLRPFSGGTITDVASGGSTIYASLAGSNNDTLRKVVRSTDNGQTWQDLTDNLYSFVQFKFHPVSDLELLDGNLFACISDMLFKSGGGGSSGLGKSIMHKQADVYPNPASGTIHIDVKGRTSLRFFDSSGRLCMEALTENGQADVSSLPRGLYHIEATNGSGTFSTRLIKE